MGYKEYCNDTYNELYSREYRIALNGRTSRNAMTAAEREGQKKAILGTLTQALDEYDGEQEAAELWKAILLVPS